MLEFGSRPRNPGQQAGIVLSYRHGFHAGNFADVHKHFVLVLLLTALRTKENPFFCLDTHGGGGLYDLHSPFARKTGEAKEGIGRVWALTGVPGEFEGYLDMVRAVNPTPDLRFYPGSPRIIRHLLRENDRLLITELHGSEVPRLRELFARDRRVVIRQQDGYEALRAYLPPSEHRGMVLIDPPYERKEEFDRVATALIAGWRKWPTGMFALWYPLEIRTRLERLQRTIAAAGIRKVMVSEFLRYPAERENRLNGSGMLIINPPCALKAALDRTLPWLLAQVAPGPQGHASTEWLIPE